MKRTKFRRVILLLLLTALLLAPAGSAKYVTVYTAALPLRVVYTRSIPTYATASGSGNTGAVIDASGKITFGTDVYPAGWYAYVLFGGDGGDGYPEKGSTSLTKGQGGAGGVVYGYANFSADTYMIVVAAGGETVPNKGDGNLTSTANYKGGAGYCLGGGGGGLTGIFKGTAVPTSDNEDIIAVAGGGGGGSSSCESSVWHGGAAGSIDKTNDSMSPQTASGSASTATGGDVTKGGAPGTDSAGGLGGYDTRLGTDYRSESGSLLKGGSAGKFGSGNSSLCAGGGGGGYYGGGAGGYTYDAAKWASGGGGGGSSVNKGYGFARLPQAMQDYVTAWIPTRNTVTKSNSLSTVNPARTSYHGAAVLVYLGPEDPHEKNIL